MASISTDAAGNRRILFSIGKGAGSRKQLRMGDKPLRIVEEVKRRIELLIVAHESNISPDRETAAWCSKLDPKLHDKLAVFGLLAKRVVPEQATLAAFIDGYITSRTDVSDGTAKVFNIVRRNLVEYFGADKPLADISPGDGDEFRRWLRAKVGDSTTGRRCGFAKQFFRAAVRKRLIAENPFADMKGINSQRNRERFYFVSRAEAAKVLEACPTNEWRLLFALSRFGGLRCPSEHLGLRWGDIHWPEPSAATGRDRAGWINVTSPKTAHHEGKDHRTIPIFPELLSYLETAWDAADEGAEYVITRTRDSNSNLRTYFIRIIELAGLKPWPKLFQNLRSTRQTELAEIFPMHVVCDWIGNSVDVAKDHYLQTTEDHFEKAAQKWTQQASETAGKGRQPEAANVGFTGVSTPLPACTHEQGNAT